MQRHLIKILGIIGLLTTVIGLGIHLSAPCVIRSDYGKIESGAILVESFQVPADVQNNNFTFYLIMSIEKITPDNLSMVLVNASEYQKFADSGSTVGLTPIVAFSGQFLAPNNTVVDSSLSLALQGTFYLLVWNKTALVDPPNFYLFMSATSPLFLPGLLVTACGTCILMIFLAWYLIGWKRYMVIGIGVNLIPFFLHIALSPTLVGIPSYPIEFFHPELYNDFTSYYLNWVQDIAEGLLPYTPAMDAYIYPPLFLYTLAAFSYIPLPSWQIALPFFICTLLSGYLVFKIVEKITRDERRATGAMLVYFLNPFTLIYGNFSWLNPPLLVFFVLLAFYLALSNRHSLAMVSLGIATMFKQFAGIFFPLLLIVILKSNALPKWRSTLSQAFKLVALYSLPIIIVSFPFLITNASGYLQQALIGGLDYSLEYLTIFNPATGMPVTFNTFFLWVAFPPSLTTIIGYLLQFYILLAGGAIIIYAAMFCYPKKRFLGLDDSSRASQLFIESLFLSIILVLCLQLFYPRGSYKYYLMLLTPFISMFYDEEIFLPVHPQGDSKAPFHNRFLTSTIISWIIFFCNRYVYFLFLLAWLVFFLYRKAKMNRAVIKINANAIG